MSVLIKGMDSPTKENFMTQLYLICDEDGNWYAVDTTNKNLYKVIEVKEPHGRLGDLDELWNRMYNYIDNEGAKMPFGDNDFMIHKDSACELIEDASTIIEAEVEE